VQSLLVAAQLRVIRGGGGAKKESFSAPIEIIRPSEEGGKKKGGPGSPIVTHRHGFQCPEKKKKKGNP